MKRRNGNASKARNLVRGALSNLRALSTPDVLRDDWRQDQFVQQQINKALAIARRELGRRELGDFEKWVTESVADQKRATNGIGTPLTSLGILPTELASRDLPTEFGLALAKLERHLPSLRIFATDAALIARNLALRDWDESMATLKGVIKRDSYSYWAVETELALTQFSTGVEAVKTHIRSLSICALGLNKFFLYFFGVRNEPAQTSSRFKTNLRKRIDESDLSADLQVYAKYRLYGELSSESSKLAQVLACEQLTTAIDLSFTTSKISQLILNNEEAFSPEVVAIANQAKALLLSIVISEVENSAKTKSQIARVYSPLVEIASRSVQLAFTPSDGTRNDADIDGHIVRGIASQLSTRDDGVAAEELTKELLNLSWTPIAFELGDISAIPPLPKLIDSAYSARRNGDGVLVAIAAVLRLEHREVLNLETQTLLQPFVEALCSSTDAHHGQAVQILKQALLSNTANATAQDALNVMLANELHRSDELQECLMVSAQTGIDNDKLIPLLPLVEIFQGVKWPALKRLGSSVDLPIALDHFLRVVESRKIRTFKRYSIEELMSTHGCASIVDLSTALVDSGVDVRRVEYFFSQVCDIFSLELLPGMQESKKVRLTRTTLLRQLAELHTKQEGIYLQEAQDIEDALQVDDGLYVLDDSKVYVDEQAVLNFANQELAADFQRYLKLVESGLGVSDSINEVLKGFNNPSAKTFQIPKNDADDLLAELISTILHRFLFDPASGLDIIVGRRIRHGTIAGEIRGVLEKAGLIGHKPRAGASYGVPPKIECAAHAGWSGHA